MSARAETAPKLILTEADLIETMRLILRRAEIRVRDEAYDKDRPQDYGRLCEAIDAADHALFNILNVASSFLDCSASKTILAAKRSAS